MIRHWGNFTGCAGNHPKILRKEVNIKVSEEQSNGNRVKRGGKVLIAAALIVIIVLLIVIVVLLLKRKAEPAAPIEPAAPERETLVTEENAEAVVEEMLSRDESIPKSYNVTMNTEWFFEDGSKPSPDAYVENSTENTTGVYFDVKIADTGETIFESPIIPVGESMSNIKLDKDLDAGTYDCVCTYHLVDDDGHTLTTLNVSVKINVGN